MLKIQTVSRALTIGGAAIAFHLVAASAACADDAMTQNYAQNAAMGDLFEIESSELAMTQGDGDTVRFASMMTTDHAKTSRELADALTEAGLKVDLPKKLDAEHAALLKQLQGVKGAQFDAKYLEMQRDAHQKALNLHQEYSEHGDVPALQKFATGGVTVVEHHLKDLEQIKP